MSASCKGPEISGLWLLAMQVCVPKGWTDEQVVAFAEMYNPCGTTEGWHVRKQDVYDEEEIDALERGPCCDKEDFVHIMLDA